MCFLTVNVAPNQVQIPSDIDVVTSVNSLNPIQLYIYFANSAKGCMPCDCVNDIPMYCNALCDCARNILLHCDTLCGS
jgi:hypothetical protein